MISDRTRNSIVGLTILISLVVAIWGISLLGRFPSFTKAKPYDVTLEAPNANGVMTGAKVDLNGVYIGTVKSVRLVTVTRPLPQPSIFGTAVAPATGPAVPTVIAEVVIRVDNEVNIPTSATASIGKQAIGTPFVTLQVAVTTGEFLAKDGSARISAGQADSGLFPKEIFTDIHVLKEDLGTLSRELTTVARDLHTMLVFTPLERLEQFPPGDPRRPAENISTLVLKLNRTVDAINLVLADPKFQNRVDEIVKNIAEASGDLKEVLARINTTLASADKSINKIGSAADNISGAATRASATLDVTQAEIIRVAEGLAKTTQSLNTTLDTLSNEKGTTGRLMKDPRLYEGLVDLTKSLHATTEELNKLVHQWKQDGVPLRVGFGGNK